jgi:hypothetical protein
MAILANSAGWNWTGPTLTARNAPLTCEPIPGRRGIISSAIPAAAIV